jgi:hypothetical protein
MDMKQTAVEWLEFEINRRGPKEDNPPQWLKELYEQAKEMEKEQMEKVWVAGLYCETGDRQAFIDYYNETFKSE